MSVLPGSISAKYTPTANLDNIPASASLARSSLPGSPTLLSHLPLLRPALTLPRHHDVQHALVTFPTLTILYNTRIAYHVHCCFHSAPFRPWCPRARACLALVVTAERPQVSCLPPRRPPCPPSLPTLSFLSCCRVLSCICIAFHFPVFLIVLSNLCMPHFVICFLDTHYLPPLGQSSQERI